MEINYKARHTTLDQEIKQYCEKRMNKVKKLLPENTFIELEFIDEFGEKGGIDKRVQVDISIPGEKQAIHMENSAIDWKTSIDYLQDRLEEELCRRKDRLIENHRQPREDKV